MIYSSNIWTRCGRISCTTSTPHRDWPPFENHSCSLRPKGTRLQFKTSPCWPTLPDAREHFGSYIENVFHPVRLRPKEHRCGNPDLSTRRQHSDPQPDGGRRSPDVLVEAIISQTNRSLVVQQSATGAGWPWAALPRSKHVVRSVQSDQRPSQIEQLYQEGIR